MGVDWERQDLPGNAAELRSRVARTVRELRMASGQSLADLSLRAGIGKSTLHAIESGEANPGIETLWSLARALDIPFGALLEPPLPQVRVVRAGEGPRVGSEDEAMQARLLATAAHGSRVELYAITLGAGRLRAAQPHGPGTVEHVLVTRGQLRVGPSGGQVELGPGDLASFPGDQPHHYDALDDDVDAILMIEYS